MHLNPKEIRNIRHKEQKYTHDEIYSLRRRKGETVEVHVAPKSEDYIPNMLLFNNWYMILPALGLAVTLSVLLNWREAAEPSPTTILYFTFVFRFLNAELFHITFAFFFPIVNKSQEKAKANNRPLMLPSCPESVLLKPFPSYCMDLFENGLQRYSDIIKEWQGSFLYQEIILVQEWTVYLLGNPF